ncbi:hypothetical protein [Streptomyces blattellae]|uniref:hypothetical protein n=1 Tax=Streptomyces blattellae TaxID=2569855 RepID=UPI0012B850CE|nr:hypothetical protein [Streptomyces blattellae]
MRKLHQVALVVAAAGGLSTVGAGPSYSAPVAYNGAPPPVSQQDAQATSMTSAQATSQNSGPSSPRRMALPTRGADVSPQVNPQFNPKLSPNISPQAAPHTGPGQGEVGQTNLFRPSQECSPQSLLNAAVPVAVLAAAENRGIECGQTNSQANSLAHARATTTR